MLVQRPALPLFLSSLAAVFSSFCAIAGLVNLDLYRSTTPPHLIPGTVSQDIGTVVVAGVLIMISVRLPRGHDRLWFIWLGGLGYLAYGYAIFVFEAVLNPIFPIYLAVLSLSIWAVIAFFARLNPEALKANNPPRKVTAILFAVLTVIFLLLWSSILLPAMASRARPDGMTIFALDLVFVLPALMLTAVLLWRGANFGDILAIPLLIKAGSIGLSVLLGTLISPSFGFSLNVAEVATYALMGFGPLLLVLPWMRAFGPGKGFALVHDHPLRAPEASEYADAPGQTHSSHGPGRGAMARRDPKALATSEFAQQVADELDMCLAKGAFARMVIVAGPHMLGELRAVLSTSVRAKVLAEVDKDLTHVSPEDLPKHLANVLAA